MANEICDNCKEPLVCCECTRVLPCSASIEGRLQGIFPPGARVRVRHGALEVILPKEED